MLQKFSAACLLSICLISVAYSQDNPGIIRKYDMTDKLPVDPQFRQGILPNGMKYFLKYNAKPEKHAELRLAVDAGSLQEDEDQLGVAHFVEHMAFNGSEHFKKNELVDYLESIGTRFGADLNAYTSFDETVYMIQSRTDSLPLLEKGLLVLQDWAGGLDFDHSEIDKERGVVVSEWRTRLSPDQRMQQKAFPIIYQGSQYADRLPIGKPELIETVDYETVKKFYTDWYRPNLMALVVVGDFDLNWMEEQIKSRFSGLQNPAAPRPRVRYEMTLAGGTRSAIFSDKEAPFTQIEVMYQQPEQKTRTLEDFKNSLARSLYNRMLNARLFELRQQSNPPFTFASSGYGSDLGNLDAYFVSAFTPEGKALDGLEVVLIETRRALLHGFTATELERQKAEMIRAVEKEFKEKDKLQSGQLASQGVSYFLHETPLLNPAQRLNLYKEFLPRVTLEEINHLPYEWISKENRVINVTAPEKEGLELPTEEAILALLDKVDEMKPEPYVDQVSDKPLMEENLPETKIADEKSFESLGITEWTLANGVRVVLKPTDFKNDEILMAAYSPGGNSLYPDADYQNASNASGIVNQSGIAGFSVVELEKMLAGKTVGVGPYIGELNEGLNGSCSPQDLETLFQLTYLYFKQPRIDEKALETFKSQQESILQNMMINPYYYFSDEKNKIKYNNHPRRHIPTVEEIESLDLKKMESVYKDRFADAGDFTFFFVGNFEVEAIRPLISRYLGNLPSTGRKETWKDVHSDLVNGKIDKTITRGKAPKALVELVYHGDFPYLDSKARYDFYSLMDVLRIKLRESMREDKGGVYGVSVNGSASQFPTQKYAITIGFNAEPEKVEELIGTALAEVAKLQQEGPGAKDIAKVQETQRQSRIKDLKENRFWLGQLRARYENNLPLDGLSMEEYEKTISGLNAADLQKGAKAWFDADNFMRFVLLPEAEAEGNR